MIADGRYVSASKRFCDRDVTFEPVTLKTIVSTRESFFSNHLNGSVAITI